MNRKPVLRRRNTGVRVPRGGVGAAPPPSGNGPAGPRRGSIRHGAAATAVPALVALAAVAGASGCSDHRLDLASFMDMQRAMRAAAAARTVAASEQHRGPQIDQRLGPYRVGPNDVLTVTMTGADATTLFPPMDVRVDRYGEIDLPVIGGVQVGGMALVDIEDTIRASFVPHVVRQAEDVSVHVTVTEPNLTRVLVVGAVVNAGLVPLRATERNMLHAIVGAGGVTSLGSGNATLRRIRRPAESITLNLTDPVDLAEAIALDPLEDGDIITVEAAIPNTVFVGGLVNGPAPQMYPPGTSVTFLQAIAAAGGLRTDVTPTEATLIRRMPDGKDAHVKIDLRAVASGRAPNIVLAGGDIVWVPETFGTRVQDFINRNIFLRAGATVTYSATAVDFLNNDAERSQGGQEQNFDPLGFLARNAALQSLTP
ncbi:MAG: polysaccharide biosynthesis/export family protein [Phycisphaerae bacterium]